MKKTKKARFATVIATFLVLIMAWASYSLFTTDFNLTSYWGVGIGFSLALFLMFVLLGRSFGYTRGFIATTAIFIVIALALILNSTRGWPFGLAYYHSILGWKFYKVAWPIPVLWSAIVTGALMIKKPIKVSSDPKILFSWAFDSAIITTLISLMIEPIAKITMATTWVSGGAVLGVPISAFLGWFITSFIASVVAIIILKPWQNDYSRIHCFVPLSLAAFSLLMLIFSTKLNLTLIQILSAVSILVFFFWTMRFKTSQNTSIICDS